MGDLSDRRALERVVRRVEPAGALAGVWPLPGGSSARLTVVEVRLPRGERRRFVVRQHGEANRGADSRIAAHEFRLLRTLRTRGIPVPAARFLDESRTILSTPYIVIDYVDDAVQLVDYVNDPAQRASPPPIGVARQLAAALAKIHAVDVAAAEVSFLPRQDERMRALLARAGGRLDPTTTEGRAVSLLTAALPLALRNQRVLLHGDFWPGNTLWKGNHLVAIVDWDDAAIGDPLADVANCRLELLWAYGAETAIRFTEQYRRAAPGVDLSTLPHWDVYAGLHLGQHLHGWGLPQNTEMAMREKYESFLANALQRI
jgi:aminoglycoside phosphotransferase (APT) family kinase protein